MSRSSSLAREWRARDGAALSRSMDSRPSITAPLQRQHNIPASSFELIGGHAHYADTGGSGARVRGSARLSTAGTRSGVSALRLFVILAVLAIVSASITSRAPLANGLGSAKPTLVEGKFAVPTDLREVTRDWVSRGFAPPTTEIYPRGWARTEHAYSHSLVMTPITGRMEFIIADQRVVIGPGDELYYPARAVMLARNLHHGVSRVLVSRRR